MMVVDDDPDIQTVAGMALEMISGWNVVGVPDPREGVESASNSQPDVILLDWMMPNMTGIDVFRALRANASTATIPVIFMTAKVQPQDRKTISSLGCDVIAKPFDPLLLGVQIEELLERYSNRAA